MKENKTENKSLFKTHGGKIWIILFVIALLFVGAAVSARNTDISADAVPSQNLIGSLRNMRTDRLLASVRQKKDSAYTESDIDAAVAAVKEDFKKKPWFVSLTKIYFDEEESDSVLDGYCPDGTYVKSDVIVINFSYYVYKDEAEWQTGEYDGWVVILTRETAAGEWVIRDSGDKGLIS